MRTIAIYFFIVLLSCSFAQSDLIGPYFGQKPPGLTPEVFAPGVISTADKEQYITFSADGNEIYVDRIINGKSVITYYKCINNTWEGPFEIVLADNQKYSYLQIEKTTNTMVSSLITRIDNQNPKIEIVLHKNIDGKWIPGEPLFHGMRGSMSANGSIYVTEIDTSKTFFARIVKYILKEGKYTGPISPGEKINYSEFTSEKPYIAPDENFIIYVSEDGHNRDLYINFKNSDGSWCDRKNISSFFRDLKISNFSSPTLSPDGKFLFFFGDQDIYWVDAKIIEQFGPRN